MSTLLWSSPDRDPVPTDVAEVRSTITVVNEDAPPAVEEAPPEWNDADTDPDTDGGLTPHQLASYIKPGERYIGAHMATADTEHNEIVNRQIASSGTAAQREATGQWGHGTMPVIEGIEPTIVDGHAFGETYFAANQPEQVSTSGVSASAPADPATSAAAQAAAEANARAAVQASQYAAFYAARTGL